MSSERLKNVQHHKNRKRAFLLAVAKYLTHKPRWTLFLARLGDSDAKLWGEIRGAALIGPETSDDSKEVADKLAKWFEVEAIMCGGCRMNEATTECSYGRCGMSACKNCVNEEEGLCKNCAKPGDRFLIKIGDTS